MFRRPTLLPTLLGPTNTRTSPVPTGNDVPSFTVIRSIERENANPRPIQALSAQQAGEVSIVPELATHRAVMSALCALPGRLTVDLPGVEERDLL